MGLFDQLKNIALNKANDVLNQAKEDVIQSANDAKDEAIQNANNKLNEMKTEAQEELKVDVKEKGINAITSGINSYLDNAEKNVTTEDGKEAVATLKSMVSTSENIYKTAGDVDTTKNEEYMQEAGNELQKLSEIADKYNNNN